MRKIILILFLTSIFAEYNNPNGEPLTLNIKFNLESIVYPLDVGNPWNSYGPWDYRIDANLPITSFITMHGGIFFDRYEETFIWESGFNEGKISTLNHSRYTVFYGGIELHLPLPNL